MYLSLFDLREFYVIPISIGRIEAEGKAKIITDTVFYNSKLFEFSKLNIDFSQHLFLRRPRVAEALAEEQAKEIFSKIICSLDFPARPP